MKSIERGGGGKNNGSFVLDKFSERFIDVKKSLLVSFYPKKLKTTNNKTIAQNAKSP
jgi:hypothetical protein